MRWCCGVGMIALLAGCGGEPVGARVPKANTKVMAAGAAAAATAITLADPDRPAPTLSEAPGERALAGVPGSGETVPADVLDRADGQGPAGQKACEEPDSERTVARERVELLPAPAPRPGGVEPPPRPPICKPADRDEPTDRDAPAD